MNLKDVPRKQLNQLEIRVTELLNLMRKAKIQDETLIESLKDFEKQLADIRVKRFDDSTPEYKGY